MEKCGNRLCQLRTKNLGSAYCQRLTEAESQAAYGGFKTVDLTGFEGSYWPRENLERYIEKSKQLADQEGCAKASIREDLQAIIDKKNTQGEIIS